MASLLERLKTEILVADGAMGTLLYAHGLDTCHESYNLTHPDEILSIHQAYLEAGADIIQTNTYAAQTSRLRAYGLDKQAKAINQAGVALARQAAGDQAFVLGTIGALRGTRHCDLSLGQIVAQTIEQAGYLLDTGQLDGLLLETYYDFEEISTVLPVLRDMTSLPIVTNLALHEAGVLENGMPLEEAFAELTRLGADVVGLNCHLGPYHMIKSFKQVSLPQGSYLAAYPNASLLSLEDNGQQNKYRFSNNADYFKTSSRLLVAEGVRLIGGCCGTTPDHVRAIKRGVRKLKPVEEKDFAPTADQEILIAPVKKGKTLVDKVKSEVTIIAELDPPKSLQIDQFQEAVRALDDKGIAAITLADNSLANTRICNLSLAASLKDEISTPFLLHMACRDHNLIGLQSRLMGLDVLGFDHILAVTGDPSKMGDFPGATSVYDLTSFKLISLAKQLNQGQSYSGASLKKATNFTVAAAFNPNIRHLAKAGRVIEKKIAAGADYFITQPIFDQAIIHQLAQVVEPYEQPFFVGVMPITSYNNAIFLHNEVPGIQLSEDFLAKLEAVKDDKAACQALALAETKALIDAALQHFKGIYLITPFMRYDLTVELIDYIQSKG